MTALLFLCAAFGARADTFTATFTLAALPSTITLCRDSAAIQANNGVDEQWAALVNVDNDVATGGPGGFDAVLVVQTLQQQPSCSATVVNTANALVAGVFTWNGSGYEPAAQADFTLDFTAHTIAVSADMSGVLGNIYSTTLVSAQTLAGYSTTDAADATAAPIGPNASTTDPSGDVGNCSSPCSAAASYYGLIDLVGFATKTSVPVDAFGQNTLTFEFDLASLPASFALCRNPAVFASAPGVDSVWIAAIDADNDPNTGFGGFDAAVVVSSTPQSMGCSSSSAPIAQALAAELATIDPSTGELVYAATLPFTVDQANGRIFVQADRTAPLLSAFSTGSVAAQTQAYYAAVTPPASDSSVAYGIGTSVSDPTGDVQQCSGSCSPAQPWYPQTDLTGAALLRPNHIFTATFE